MVNKSAAPSVQSFGGGGVLFGQILQTEKKSHKMHIFYRTSEFHKILPLYCISLENKMAGHLEFFTGWQRCELDRGDAGEGEGGCGGGGLGGGRRQRRGQGGGRGVQGGRRFGKGKGGRRQGQPKMGQFHLFAQQPHLPPLLGKPKYGQSAVGTEGGGCH